MVEKIAVTAGTIYEFLDKYGPTTVSQLTRKINAYDKLIHQGIGWLAKEDKIIMYMNKGAATISLK